MDELRYGNKAKITFSSAFHTYIPPQLVHDHNVQYHDLLSRLH